MGNGLRHARVSGSNIPVDEVVGIAAEGLQRVRGGRETGGTSEFPGGHSGDACLRLGPQDSAISTVGLGHPPPFSEEQAGGVLGDDEAVLWSMCLFFTFCVLSRF